MTPTARYLQQSRLTARQHTDDDARYARVLVSLAFLAWILAMTLFWGA